MLGSASDLAFMLKDAGGNTAVKYNGVCSFGILDISSGVATQDDGGVTQVRQISVLIATAAFDNLRLGGKIDVADERYKIEHVDPEDDGALSRIYLARIT